MGLTHVCSSCGSLSPRRPERVGADRIERLSRVPAAPAGSAHFLSGTEPGLRTPDRDWNTKSNSFVGFVTRFEVDDAFVSRYPVQIVGARVHEELWVPADELVEFNRHILGTIEVIESYAGLEYPGRLDPATHLPVGWAPERERDA